VHQPQRHRWIMPGSGRRRRSGSASVSRVSGTHTVSEGIDSAGSCAVGSVSAAIGGVVVGGYADGVAAGVAAVGDVDQLVADPETEPGLVRLLVGVASR
jgi:hypothetical protein